MHVRRWQSVKLGPLSKNRNRRVGAMLSWGRAHAFFKRRCLKSRQLLGFLNWRMPGTHGACADKVPKTKLSSRKMRFVYSYTWHRVKSLSYTNPSQTWAGAAESRFTRSSLALGMKTVVMEMVSSEFYWVNRQWLNYIRTRKTGKVYVGDLEWLT
jgi:hypothetical protein